MAGVERDSSGAVAVDGAKFFRAKYSAPWQALGAACCRTVPLIGCVDVGR